MNRTPGDSPVRGVGAGGIRRARRMRAAALAIVAASALLMSATCGADASDWPNTIGGAGSPFVTDAPSPIADADGNVKARVLWHDAGTIKSMAGSWLVPYTAICIGEHTYYVKCTGEVPGRNVCTLALNKVVTATGETVASRAFEARSQYNVHLASGDGKIFVPMYLGKNIRLQAFDADTLAPGTVFDPAYGVDATQNYITYTEGGGRGYVMFGTYTGPFYCFDATTGKKVWDTGSFAGYSNQLPVRVGDFVVVADCGAHTGGASLHVCDMRGGEVYTRKVVGEEWGVFGPMAHYDGRLYLACQNRSMTEVRVYSYAVTAENASLHLGDDKMWSCRAGPGEAIGTQAGVVVANGRVYLGGGGATMGSDMPIYVIDVGGDGGMSTAYSIPVKTKGTPTVSVQDGVAYLYFTPYDCHAGARLYVARDVPGQTEAVYGYFDLNISGDRVYSYQPVSIAPGGELLVRLDTDLLCLGGLASYGGSEYATGDLDGDGVHGYLDLALMARVDRGLAPREAYYDAAGDCNWDGRFDGEDLVIAMEKSAGTRSNLCPERRRRRRTRSDRDVPARASYEPQNENHGINRARRRLGDRARHVRHDGEGSSDTRQPQTWAPHFEKRLCGSRGDALTGHVG